MPSPFLSPLLASCPLYSLLHSPLFCYTRLIPLDSVLGPATTPAFGATSLSFQSYTSLVSFVPPLGAVSIQLRTSRPRRLGAASFTPHTPLASNIFPMSEAPVPPSLARPYLGSGVEVREGHAVHG